MTEATSSRSQAVAALFDRNAARYDAVNTVISLGRDAEWRRWAAGRALEAAGAGLGVVLDACGGTGLVTRELARAGAQVTLADFSAGMLAVAARRTAPWRTRVRLEQADLTRTSAAALPGAPFAAATMVFGLRYVAEPGGLLRNVAAGLSPVGTLVLLDFVVPPRGLASSTAAFYFFRVLPRLATLLAGRAELYRELTRTVRTLGRLEDLLSLVDAAGLEVRERRTFARGIVAGVVVASRSGSVAVPNDLLAGRS